MCVDAAINSERPVLRTARLSLRRPEARDAPAIAAMMTPGISAAIGAWRWPFTIEMAQARVAEARARAEAGLALPWVMERRADAAVLGWIDVVRHPALLARATIGYWLGEAHHGQGYMREAAGPVIADALARLDLDAVEAMVQRDNLRSVAVLRGAGMRLVGPVRQQGGACLLFEKVGGMPVKGSPAICRS